MTDQSAAEHLVLLTNLMPRLQAAYAASDWQTILELSVYAREYAENLKRYAAQKLQPIPAVERPMVGAYFPGQY